MEQADQLPVMNPIRYTWIFLDSLAVDRNVDRNHGYRFGLIIVVQRIMRDGAVPVVVAHQNCWELDAGMFCAERWSRILSDEQGYGFLICFINPSLDLLADAGHITAPVFITTIVERNHCT